jgi:ubiquinone/menaquinone biosynthesis C-methylase UbiE
MRLVALAVALAACSSSAPQPQPAPGSAAADPGGRTYEGRPIAQTMSYLGADWLDRPDRAEREQPDRVLDALHLAPDSTAADVGAGTGYFTVRLAKRVKAVHATDLQPEMLRMLDVRLGKERITNVTLHRATDHDSGLPVGCCDLVILVDVYHELSDPPGVMVTIRRALKPTGRLVLVEYRGEDPAVAIKPEHKMTLVQIKKELGELGFHFVDSLEMLPDQRVVIFTRDDA